jgi:hypothetical protein
MYAVVLGLMFFQSVTAHLNKPITYMAGSKDLQNIPLASRTEPRFRRLAYTVGKCDRWSNNETYVKYPYHANNPEAVRANNNLVNVF